MDISFFLEDAVQGIPLIAVVVILVQFLKGFKKEDGSPLIVGNALLASSFGIGLVLGVLYMVYAAQPVGTNVYEGYQYWFASGIYGITLGGLASGSYETLKAIFEAAVEKLYKKGIEKAVTSGQEH